jgi:hypothetical protein
MNALKLTAIGAEIALLGSTATIAWGLVGGSSAPVIVVPMIGALLAVEALRLPLVMRAPKLGAGGAVMALTLAAALAGLTGETTALGVENLLNARAIGVTVAETKFSEAKTSFDAAKAEAGRRGDEIAQAQAAVAAAQKHSEEVGRESVALQNNPSVSAYRNRKGWTAPGGAAANTVAAANARAQAEHAKHVAAAETDLAQARTALAAVKPVDIKTAEADLVAAKKDVEQARAASPMHRLAASFFRVGTADLTAEGYESVRRVAILSLAAVVSAGTLVAGLISALPERGTRSPSKLSRALRAMIAARRKTIRRLQETVRTEYRDRTIFRYVPTDPVSGRVLDPDLPRTRNTQ